MRNKHMLVAACSALAMLAFAGSTQAHEQRAGTSYRRHVHVEHHATSRYHRRRPVRVRGFLARRGGYYSYTDADVVNVYGGSRALYGSTNTYRDPFVDRQTTAGPFDHGFFFDSGTGPRGGDAPYPR
jgi:hypothetical protein